jgi:hypothetical protein
MTRHPDDLDDLYRAVAAVIGAKSSSESIGELRTGLVGGDLGNLLLWNILVAGALHLGCHLLGDNICEALKRNHLRLSRGEKQAVSESKNLMSQVVEHPPLLIPYVDETDRSQALIAIKKILIDLGRSEETASGQAEEVVRILLAKFL